MRAWNRSLSSRVTVSVPSRASTTAGMPFHAMIWYVATRWAGRARLRAAHELGEERDPVAGLDGRIERVGDAEHGVVHEHLDVLTELAPVPERRVELRVPRRQARKDAPHRRPWRERLLEDAPARAVAADELRDPGGDLDGDGRRRIHPAHADPPRSASSTRSATGPARTQCRTAPSSRRSAPPGDSAQAPRGAGRRGGATASARGPRARSGSRRPAPRTPRVPGRRRSRAA